MTEDMTPAEAGKAPWHLWLVGVLSLLWNGFGAFDFVMTSTRGEAYMREAGFSQAMIDYYLAMPTWMWGPWILGVWGAVIGTILLLARRRWAIWAFAASLVGAVVSLIYGKVINPPPIDPASDMATMMTWMPWVIVLIAAFLAWYAWSMGKKGVLR